MASAVADLEAGLTAMSALKPPGVSGSRISSLTALCVANVQSESVLIQKIYTHFKKTDADHKLGVLYVVDSVTRKWMEQAKSNGQLVDGSAKDGTFAAGVHRVTELMPILMNDMISSAPNSQKEKISKLLDIWEKGQTFPQPLIDSFRHKLSSAPPQVKSTTPDGSPPPGLIASMGLNNGSALLSAAPPAVQPPIGAPTAQNSNAIMQALANIAKQNVATAPAHPSGNGHHVPLQGQAPAPIPAAAAPGAMPATSSYDSLAGLLSNISKLPPAAPNAAPPTLPMNASQQAPPMPTNPPYGSSQYPPQGPPDQRAPPAGYGAAQAGGFPGGAPPPPAAPGLSPDMQQQVMLIKLLADQGVPVDQIPALIQAMQATGAIQPSAPAQASAPVSSYQGGQSWGGGYLNDSRERTGYAEGGRSPGRYRRRSRSQSPGRRWDQRDSPRGPREDYGRQYDDHGNNGRSGRDSDYRQRSPAGRRGRSPSPPRPPAHRGHHEKWVEYDRKLPEGHIRVYSRTLFVGGVTCSEQELRALFSRYGKVQTCIVNKDKRHAFVKMVTRRDAEKAKEGMEQHGQGSGGLQLRTRWGVGFGPRDCSDYASGVSVIPITSLTDADRKWMLSAEYGGSGGRPIESGLVVEEPDIEIGAGVSSKAISRRMQTDKGGSHGPKSSRPDDRYRRGKDRREDTQASGANAQPVAQQFPFGIGTMPNGMPNFPPGFVFPAPNGQVGDSGGN